MGARRSGDLEKRKGMVNFMTRTAAMIVQRVIRGLRQPKVGLTAARCHELAEELYTALVLEDAIPEITQRIMGNESAPVP